MLPEFAQLERELDRRSDPVPVMAAGGADGSLLRALRVAADRGWIQPGVTGPRAAIESLATDENLSLDGFRIVDSDQPARSAVAECRAGRSRVLVKGLIDTPLLMDAIIDPEHGLRAGRAVCQVVLMELPRDGRRLLLADTGVMRKPKLRAKAEILRLSVALAHRLGLEEPRVAVVAASETIQNEMPETLDAAELQRMADQGAFPGCRVQGPLAFDLAYDPAAARKKRAHGPVVGQADILIFPDLASANLSVKAIMYTAECRFGGVLMGTTIPVAFMSRSDTVQTRLHSLVLALSTRSGDHSGIAL